MTEQTIQQPVDPAQVQIDLLKQIAEDQKRTAARLGWLVFFATLSFLSGILAFFNAL